MLQATLNTCRGIAAKAAPTAAPTIVPATCIVMYDGRPAAAAFQDAEIGALIARTKPDAQRGGRGLGQRF